MSASVISDMRNPWVHDEIPDDGSIYQSRAKLLGAVLWGICLLVAGLFIMLSGSDSVDIGAMGASSTLVTTLVAGFVLVFVVPLLLKLLAVSRLLASVTFLGTSWLVGRFVIEREAEQLEEIKDLAAVRELPPEASEATSELSELLDIILMIL
jgi:hypothetical protein